MKITICDPCKTFDKVNTETLRYMRVKGRPDLRLDICDKHSKVVNKMNMDEYSSYVLKCHGFDVSKINPILVEA